MPLFFRPEEIDQARGKRDTQPLLMKAQLISLSALRKNSVNYRCVVLNVKDIDPTFVMRHHAVRTGVIAPNICVMAGRIQVCQYRQGIHFVNHVLMTFLRTLNRHDFSQKKGQVHHISICCGIDFDVICFHRAPPRCTKVSRNTLPLS